MNTSKIYYDSDGNQCTIWQMIKREPEWAANRLQEGEKAINELRTAKKLCEIYYDIASDFIGEDKVRKIISEIISMKKQLS